MIKHIKYLLIIFPLGFFSSAVAQEFHLGVQGGFALGGVRVGENVNGNFTRFGEPSAEFSYFAGGLLEMDFENSKKISAQAELNYLQMFSNARDLGNNLPDGQFLRTNMPQISVPIFAKYQIFDRIKVQMGMFFSYIFNVTEQVNNGAKTEANEDYKNFDFGFLWGAEYDFDNGTFFVARYSLGLPNLFAGAYKQQDFVYRSRYWQLGIGYKF